MKKDIMFGKSEKRIIVFYIVAALIFVGLLLLYFYKHKDGAYVAEGRVHIAKVFFIVSSAENKNTQVDADIRYQRYGKPLKPFTLSPDEAADYTLSMVHAAYREAASNIPTAQLITEEGRKLLNEKAWEELKSLSKPFNVPARATSIKVTRMTPDPDAERQGLPVMFHIGEESGDAKAGI